jgi:hypothetical protein
MDRKLRTTAVVATALVISTAGVVAPTAASAVVDPIDVLPISGSTRWDFATGDALQYARDLLADPASFGTGGVVQRPIVIHAPVSPGALTASDLGGIDVVAATLVQESGWTAPSLAALDSFVAAGGALLVTEEGTTSDALSAHFGVTTGGNAVQFPGTDPAIIATVLAPATHPLTDGPFGQVLTFDEYASVTWYTGLGTHAHALATNDAYRYSPPIQPIDPSKVGTALAVIEPDELNAGSGPVAIVSDTDAFSRAYVCDTSTTPWSDCTIGGAVTHPELLLNTFAWLADPTGYDADGDQVSDRHDNCPAVANPDQADTDGDDTGDVCEAPDPNVAPSAVTAAFATASVACPAPGTTSNAVLNGSWTDPDSDGWSVAIDWDYDGVTFVADQTLPGLTSPSFSASRLFTSGVHTAAVRVTDDDGDASGVAVATNQFRVLYTMTGLLAPFNADGTSVWKYGSTTPVKVRITDCAGAPVAGLSPTIGTQLLSSSDPGAGIEEVTSTSGADTGNTMRYEGSGQYGFNLATKSLADGSAQYHLFVRQASSMGRSPTGAAAVGQSWQRFGLRMK